VQACCMAQDAGTNWTLKDHTQSALLALSETGNQENFMQSPRYSFVVIAALALLAVCDAPALAQGPPSLMAVNRPIPLVQGTQVGEARFGLGDTSKGGNGRPVDGIDGSSHEMLTTHIHAHLSLFYQGEQIAVPAAIGIVGPFQVKHGFVSEGQAFYWLHTHDATGIIHIESPDDRSYTLGNFFNIWGQPLNKENVAGLKGAVQAFVDGKRYTGSVRSVLLKAHEQITLVVGKPVPTLPQYVFPEGL
jgi:hypothetical protein